MIGNDQMHDRAHDPARDCPREPEMVAAAIGGSLTAARREHAAACDVCREALAIAAGLERLAAVSREAAPTHDYRVAWLAARFATRQERLARLDFLSASALGAVLAFALVGLTILLAPQFTDAVRASIWPSLRIVALVLAGIVVIAGGLGLRVLWDRKLGSR